MIYGFKGRIDSAKNCVISGVLESSVRFFPPRWRNWDVSLYTRYM